MPIDLLRTDKKKISKNMVVNISVIAGSLILGVILWISFISPKVSLIKKVEQNIKSVTVLKGEDIKLLNWEKDKLIKKKDSLASKVRISKRRLSQEKDVPTLLDKFILTAQRRKLEFTQIKPLKKKDKILEDDGVKMFMKEIPVSLEMEAGFAEFLGFLWEAEHSEEIFKITDLTIEKNHKNPVRHKEKLTISVYQLVEKGAE